MAIKELKAGIKQFKGLYQGLDDNLLNPAYSPDCQNFDVSEGILSTRKGIEKLVSYGTTLPILRVFRFQGWNGVLSVDVTIVGCEDLMGEPDNNYLWYALTSSGTQQIVDASGNPIMTDLNPAYASAVNYLIDGDPVLIITSHYSDPYYVYYESVGTIKYRAAALTGSTPWAQGCKYVTLHRERVWAAGDQAEPNTAFYSNKYDPTDWSTAGETGSIIVESFDNDYIVGIANWLDDVLIFKQHSIWKVNGDTPSEYNVTQIYSPAGVAHSRSICTNGNGCYFAGSDGIYQYNGVTVEPLLTNEIKEIFEYQTNGIQCSVTESKLYIWATKANYLFKCIVYDIKNKTLSVISNSVYTYTLSAISFSGRTIFADYHNVYEICNEKLKDERAGYSDVSIPAYWYTPESDLGLPNAEKTLNSLAFTAWGTNSDGGTGGQFKITIYYNRNGTQRSKERTVTLQAARKPYELTLNITGRLFKYKIENITGSAFNLTGWEPKYEVDEG